MKNPFPKIGKIIKYEFKHSSRILFPLYAVLLVLGLMTGISANTNKILASIEANGSYEFHAQGADAVKSMVSGLLVFAVIVLSVTATVITVVSITRRFKQSMLGEEAYLNLSLPLTMGQQLWGRFIVDFLFMLLCGITIGVTFILCFIKMDVFQGIKDVFTMMNNNFANNDFLSTGKVLWILLLNGICGSCWIISIIFVVNAITHLVNTNKGFIKFVIVVALLWCNGQLLRIVSINDINNLMSKAGYYFVRNSLLADAILLVLTVVYVSFTQYVFSKKLNLE